MSAQLIDGKKVAARIRDEVAEAVATMKAKHNYIPGLATV
jgi:5,10-methylene-tetrahydrofolate dehydrogenase/methenyl tetrahydrofolate cyclohydrolase